MPQPAFMRAFLARSEFQALLKASDFPIAATVETDIGILDVGYTYASSNQLHARWFHAVRARDSRILWLFEGEDEAALFACKFDGILRSALSVRSWLGTRA